MIRYIFIVLLLCSNNVQSMSAFSHITHIIHPCFSQLPKALQGIYIQQAGKVDFTASGLQSILDGLQAKKRPVLLDIYMWRMVMNQHVSHKTADNILINLNRLFANEPMINDHPINWNQEKNNKLVLTQELNCGAVRQWCADNINNTYSIWLQEFVYAQKNPYDNITLDGLDMSPQLVEHAATQARCHNVKAFDIKRPGLEYHEECNHQFCVE